MDKSSRSNLLVRCLNEAERSKILSENLGELRELDTLMDHSKDKPVMEVNEVRGGRRRQTRHMMSV